MFAVGRRRVSYGVYVCVVLYCSVVLYGRGPDLAFGFMCIDCVTPYLEFGIWFDYILSIEFSFFLTIALHF